MLAIAFDPGLAKTGYCIAKDGQVIRLGVITTSNKEPLSERLTILSNEIINLGGWVYSNHADKSQVGKNGKGWSYLFDLGLVEDFESRHSRLEAEVYMKMTPSMIKCATARGVIWATMADMTVEGRFVSKGKLKKEETRLLAIDRGIIKPNAPKSIQDALDAYQLLVCAGICK